MKKITLFLFLTFFCFNSYAQFPEGFEGESFPPTGWATYGDLWVKSTTTVNTGSGAAYSQYGTTGVLVTPQFTPSASEGTTLSFYQRQSYSSDYGSNMNIYVSTTAQEPLTEFVSIETQTETDLNFAYTIKEVDLSAYEGTPIYVAFVHDNDDGDNWFIDDVSLIIPPSEVPACATNFTDTADPACGNEDFNISWDAVADANGYFLTAGTTSGGTDIADALDIGTLTSITIPNVVADQSYYYTVTPYNSAGNAEACGEQSVTTVSTVCTPCDSATALTPGTQQSGDTSTFGDTFDDSLCLGYYDGGDDAVYSYVATEDNETMTVTVDFTATYGGVSMSLGCPSGDSTAYTCVGSVTGSGSGVKSFTSDALVAGETYYIHISTWAAPQSTAYTLDTVVTPAPSCLAPTSLTATSINTTGAIINWVSDGTGFMIEIQPGGVDQGNPGTGYVIGDVTNYPATTLDLTGINPDTGVGYLAPNTQYSIYVVNVCADGNSEYVGPLTFTTLPEPIVPNYTNDFSTFPGDLWSEASGAYATGPSGTFSGWGSDGFANNGSTGSARINMYGTSTDEWLISPMFDLSGANYKLDMTAALTPWNGTTDGTMGSDDLVHVLISEDNGATFTILHTWNSSNQPSAAGTNMPQVDLSSYTGLAMFAIYAESTVSNEDNDFFIDNFSITAPTSALSLQGVIDFSLPGGWAKAVHLVATEDIADLSVYGIAAAMNGDASSGTPDLNLTGSALAGDHILVAKSSGATQTLINTYMNASNVFDDVQIFNTALQNFNGDDAIELYFNGSVVEAYGEVGVDGDDGWNGFQIYDDTWAYKGADGVWTFGDTDCTDNSYYMWDSSCVYPYLVDKQATGTWGPVTSYEHTMAGIGQAGVWFKEDGVAMRRRTSATGSGSDTALEYFDDGTGQYANMQIRFNGKIDMTVMNTYTMDVYIDAASLTGSQANQLELKLQDATEAQPWLDQQTVIQEITPDVWQTVTFAFNGDDAMSRDDVDNIVVQFNSENNNDAVKAYIKNVVGSYTEPVATEYTDVTFNVDTALITGGVGANGMYLGGGVFGNATAQPMTDTDGDGIWTVTVTLEEGTAGNYVFLNSPGWDSDWGAKENLNGQSCADAGNFDDRILSAVGADDYTLNHCFGNCDTDPTTGFCIIPENDYEVTFNVDTNNVIVGDGGMYLGDGIFGGSNGVAMLDDDGDGIWTVTVTLAEGTTGNYAFFKNPGDGGDWGTKENLEGQACADTNNYNNRILDPVTADTTINYCFATCDASCGTVVRHDVTFNVDTADITVGETGMFIGGGIMGGANAIAMSDTDGDGVYTATVSIPEGLSGNYAFINGAPNHYTYDGKENLEGQACADANNYNDRFLDAVTAPATISYCFATCETSCSTAGLDDLGMSQFTYYPNPVNDQLTIRAQSNVKDITVFNMLGQVVSSQSPNAKDCLVDMAAMQSGAYFVQISIGSTVEMVRVLKQ